ncbi:hypothetical protein BD779DRAFT_1542820 [Infundibulicybe gibba]|nr:hypothetical protein BD779DRAFT_1542820 [Infundibulicybe gibba]
MPPTSFPEAWGGVMTCILISPVLAGGIAAEACSYFSRFPKDPLVLKCAVAVIWLGSLLVSAFGCWVLHSFAILGYDLPFYGVIVPPAFSIIIALETIVHSTTQGTYIFRMYRFGQNRHILACCCVLMLFEVGFGFTWAGRVAINDTIQHVDARDQGIEWVITSFFTISAFLDVFITVSMSYQLRRSRLNGLKQTKYLIDRIIRWTIRKHIITSLRGFNSVVPTATGMLTRFVFPSIDSS